MVTNSLARIMVNVGGSSLSRHELPFNPILIYAFPIWSVAIAMISYMRQRITVYGGSALLVEVFVWSRTVPYVSRGA